MTTTYKEIRDKEEEDCFVFRVPLAFANSLFNRFVVLT